LSTIKKKDGVRVPFTSANHEWKQNPKSLNLEKKKNHTISEVPKNPEI
jgi:hypothetical protein